MLNYHTNPANPANLANPAHEFLYRVNPAHEFLYLANPAHEFLYDTISVRPSTRTEHQHYSSGEFNG